MKKGYQPLPIRTNRYVRFPFSMDAYKFGIKAVVSDTKHFITLRMHYSWEAAGLECMVCMCGPWSTPE